jgi:hypothetical protein
LYLCCQFQSQTTDILLLVCFAAGACHNTVAPLVFFAYIASFNRDTPEEPPGRHYQAFVTSLWVFDTTCLAGEWGGGTGRQQPGEGGSRQQPGAVWGCESQQL